jgi:hypothetical protein
MSELWMTNAPERFERTAIKGDVAGFRDVATEVLANVADTPTGFVAPAIIRCHVRTAPDLAQFLTDIKEQIPHGSLASWVLYTARSTPSVIKVLSALEKSDNSLASGPGNLVLGKRQNAFLRHLKDLHASAHGRLRAYEMEPSLEALLARRAKLSHFYGWRTFLI